MTLQVVLLVSSEEQNHAHAISDALTSHYSITSTLRCRSVSPERLDSSDPTLYVNLTESSVADTAALEQTTIWPIISICSRSSASGAACAIAKFAGLIDDSIRDKVAAHLAAKRQAALVQDAQFKTQSPKYIQAIEHVWENNLQFTGIAGGIPGKVRDRFELSENRMALVTTDRQSGFDRHLTNVPYKGAVLNLTTAFWMEETSHIIKNHLLSVPHPYVSIVKKCQPFPIEFVVRSYMTGSTSTSIWKNYQDGVRNYCGHELPDGMKKNQKLHEILLTPTTKEEEHDRPISAQEIMAENWMNEADWKVCADAALKIFATGQKIAAEHGLILVDTKYEFGRDLETGEVLLIDEVHTPDSSRYWLASTYEQRLAEGKEPDNIDKEFLRLWFRDHCDPYKDETIPDAPKELVVELSRRYITLYEMITWKDFSFDIKGEDAIKEATGV